jgi:hypothetical protein
MAAFSPVSPSVSCWDGIEEDDPDVDDDLHEIIINVKRTKAIFFIARLSEFLVIYRCKNKMECIFLRNDKVLEQWP